MENRVITPRIRMGQSVKSKVRSSVYAVESSIWESVSSPVDISVRSSVRSLVSRSVWTQINNSMIWIVEL